MGRREPPGAVQLQFPEPARPARRGDRRRARPTRTWSRPAASRSSACKLVSEDAGAFPARAPSRRSSTTAAGCRSASGAPRTAAIVSVGTDITALKLHEEKLIDSEQRLMATVADLRSSQQTLETPDRAARRACRAIRRAEEPRRGGQPGQVEVPRQHEPRAAHAAQRHHRLLRDHGIGDVRPARRRQISRILPRHPATAASICSTSSTTSSTCRRSRPAASSSTWRTSSSTAILADAMRVVSARAQEKKLTVTAKIAPAIRLRADRRALKQIALNLLSNAVKFTPEGGRITVRGRAVARRTSSSRIQDTGIGIAARRAAEARPAVRAGREPAHQDAITARGSASPSPSR